MARLSWLKHFPEAWIQQVANAGLNPLEEWAFVRLYHEQWTKGDLPASPDDIKGWLKYQFGEELPRSYLNKITLLKVLALFPLADDRPGRRRHPDLHRLREEARSEYQAKQEGGRRGGRRSAEAREAPPDDSPRK